MGPLFSVVIPTYNRSSLLARCIGSVLRQSFTDFELVVVDDGSTDDTPDVIGAFGDARLTSVRRSNGGLSRARNAGAATGHGRYVTFLDDDDEAGEHWLARMAETVADDGVGVVCCGVQLVDPAGRLLTTILPGDLGPQLDHVQGLFVAGSFAVRRDVYAAVGGFAPGLECSHATELSLRLVPYCGERALGIRCLPEPLVRIERRDQGERPLSSPSALLSGIDYLLEHHQDRLRRAPRAIANYRAIAGVSAVRLGDMSRARREFSRALKARPLSLRHAGRLVLACVPPLGRRVWCPDAPGALDGQST